MLPQVAIIILNWNGLKDTTECLDSLRSITYPNFRIILVDNHSHNDDADELKRSFGDFIDVVENSQNFGFAKGNNIGIKKALPENANFVLLLNNDTVVKPDFLDKLVETSQKDNSDINAPKILIHGTNEISSTGGTVKWFSKFIIQHDTKPELVKAEQNFLTGCCLLIRKEVFEHIGFFDEAYFLYYEDVDLCLRARKAGYTMAVNPESVIWHKISQSVKPESETYHYFTSRNKLLFTRKNGPLLAFLYQYIRALFSVLYIDIRLLGEKDPTQSMRLRAVRNGIMDFFKKKFYENSH